MLSKLQLYVKSIKEAVLAFETLHGSLYTRALVLFARYPDFYIRYTLWRDSFSKRGEYGGKLLESDTSIIIDGFPRSANSFATRAFKLAQEDSVKIAHHRHDPAQVVAAVNKDIPTILLVREPRDAILSFAVYKYPHILDLNDKNIVNILKSIIKKYISYYECVLPYQEDLVIARFETVVSDFNVIISKVNITFGTCFRAFIHNEKNVNECFSQLDSYYAEHHPDNHETMKAFPSEKRKSSKERLCIYLQLPKLSRLLVKANNIYRLFHLNSI